MAGGTNSLRVCRKQIERKMPKIEIVEHGYDGQPIQSVRLREEFRLAFISHVCVGV